jgi:hypothetical protein
MHYWKLGAFLANGPLSRLFQPISQFTLHIHAGVKAEREKPRKEKKKGKKKGKRRKEGRKERKKRRRFSSLGSSFLQFSCDLEG